ncbi:MAG: glutamate ABC transporter substrate-binding protein [Tetrasphaera sp.]|nr:glutamate ABC transporter substrate-binding protein [Tetrasphaera sp.]
MTTAAPLARSGRRQAPGRTALVTALAGLILGTAACGYAPTPNPLATTAAPAPTASPSPSPTASTPAAPCTNRLESYAPPATLPAAGTVRTGGVGEIVARGRLIAGVSSDTYLFGARNPLTGAVEGFDIDIVKRLAKAILGDERKYELRVITAAERLNVLKAHEVDVVVRTMTITCDRWKEIAFSGEYFRAGQKLLARKGVAVTGVGDLAGKRVCAPKGTSSLTQIEKAAPDAVIVPADNHTGCLVRLQLGEADVITGDDTVLAGLAAQDPYAVVVPMQPFTEEPYGVGIAADRIDLVRLVNGVLDQMKADGSWAKSYNTWLASTLGKAPAPPVAQYGRTP